MIKIYGRKTSGNLSQLMPKQNINTEAVEELQFDVLTSTSTNEEIQNVEPPVENPSSTRPPQKKKK